MKYTHKFSHVLFFVLVFALGMFTVGAQDNAPQLQLTADKPQALAGDTVMVTVNVAGAVGVYGGSFKLSYDPQAFEVVQTDNKAVTPGAFFANEPGFALRNVADATAGTIEYAITLMQPAKPVNGGGVLGTFTLHALKDAPVAVTAMTASFVAPEFKQVDGHLVAQKVNQVAVQVQSLVSTNTLVNAPPAAQVVNAAPVQPAISNDAAVTMFSNPKLNSAPASNPVNPGSIPTETVNRTDNVVSIAAIIFLIFGVILLTLSVGMYSRMRVHYTLVSNK